MLCFHFLLRCCMGSHKQDLSYIIASFMWAGALFLIFKTYIYAFDNDKQALVRAMNSPQPSEYSEFIVSKYVMGPDFEFIDIKFLCLYRPCVLLYVIIIAWPTYMWDFILCYGMGKMSAANVLQIWPSFVLTSCHAALLAPDIFKPTSKLKQNEHV